MGKNDEIDDQLYEQIDNDEWTFYDKIVYGGLGYGNICLPSHLFDVIFTVIFPPLGLILSKLDFQSSFPYIHWGTLDVVMENIGSIIKCFLLTMCFYVPGLIYALNLLKC
jgi:uncharacterized membrane protein YqaE (UPF0057 family)